MALKGTSPINHSYGDEPGDSAAPSRGVSRHGDSSQTSGDNTDSMAPVQARSRYSAHSAVLDTLGVSRDGSVGGGSDPNSLGITVRSLTLAERQANGVDSGLMVTDVSGGLGLKAGFQPGDVVLSLDGVDLTSTDQFYKLLQKLPHDRPVPVLVHRPNSNLFLPLGAPARR
jgi:membrane-associated protease RseP (regulator of RpoE activity)